MVSGKVRCSICGTEHLSSNPFHLILPFYFCILRFLICSVPFSLSTKDWLRLRKRPSFRQPNHSPASDCESGAHKFTRIQAARWNHSTRCTSSWSVLNGDASWLFAHFVLKEHAKKLLTTIVLLSGSTHRIPEEVISCYKYCGFLFVYC